MVNLAEKKKMIFGLFYFWNGKVRPQKILPAKLAGRDSDWATKATEWEAEWMLGRPVFLGSWQIHGAKKRVWKYWFVDHRV